MSFYYRYKTKCGMFYLKPAEEDGWRAWYEDEDLGWYKTTCLALPDLTGGHTFGASCGDTSRFGIPDNISEWETIRLL